MSYFLTKQTGFPAVPLDVLQEIFQYLEIYFIKKSKTMKNKIYKIKIQLISSEFFSDIENLNAFVENAKNTITFFDSNL